MLRCATSTLRRTALAGVVLAAVALSAGSAHAEPWSLLRSENKNVRDGNEKLTAGDAKGALEAFERAARELPSDGGVHLNRGLAQLKLGNASGARDAFKLAVQSKADAVTRADAHYNLGLSFYKDADAAAGKDDPEEAQKLFREATEAFKQALRLRPGDRNAAWNFELALRRVREQQEKQKQKQEQEKKDQQKQDDQKQDPQNQDQQNQDQQKQDQQDKQDQQKQDQAKQDPQKQQEQAQQQKQDGQDQQQAEPPQPRSQTTQALDALQDSEENLERMKAMQRAARERREPEKDW